MENSKSLLHFYKIKLSDINPSSGFQIYDYHYIICLLIIVHYAYYKQHWNHKLKYYSFLQIDAIIFMICYIRAGLNKQKN